MLFLDGMYIERCNGSSRFRWISAIAPALPYYTPSLALKAPTSWELTQLTHTIAHCVGRYLERQGLLERDAENSYLAGDVVDDDPMSQLCGNSITYRIAVEPQAGRKVFTLQMLPACDESSDDEVGKVEGLHRASYPSPFGSAFGCSKSLPAILCAEQQASRLGHPGQTWQGQQGQGTR